MCKINDRRPCRGVSNPSRHVSCTVEPCSCASFAATSPLRLFPTCSYYQIRIYKMAKLLSIIAIALAATLASVDAFSVRSKQSTSSSSRRSFLSKAAGSVLGGVALTQLPNNAMAAPTIYKLDSGVKYAITKDVDRGSYPQDGDIVAVEYTGYLTDGSIFDASHSEGKSNALLFKLGSTAVTPGMNKMVAEMKVGQKVQAIIPPELAFGDKGICIDKDGKQECLVKPGSTLVYDIFLKKSAIPPP